MFSMPVLDVAIGLSFFYLLLGLICSTLNEMIAAWLRTRARFLDRGITRLLSGDSDLKAKLYKHPLIRSLASSDSHICPSYIPAQKFATALLDIISGTDNPLTDMDAVKAGAKTTNEGLQTSLKALIDSSPDAAALRRHVEQWFNDGMDRVTGWYKRNAQRNALLLAIGVTLVLNADTLNVTQTLWTNPATRNAVVESARVRAAKGEMLPMVSYPDSNSATASKPENVPQSPEDGLTKAEKDLLGQLTGWGPDRDKVNTGANSWPGVVAGHLIGWILTILAVSLGAPFWFDTLNRFMNIRNAGRSPNEPRDKTAPEPQPANA